MDSGTGERVVEEVDRGNCGFCVALWNIWQNSDALDGIPAYNDRVFVMHVSDWHTPRPFAECQVVGRGEISSVGSLRAAHEGGSRGAYTLEVFSEGVAD